MKTVPLYGKKAAARVVRVDDGDYELVIQYRWNVTEKERVGARGRVRKQGPYAITNYQRPDGRRTMIYMHKLITGWPRTDHRNHDGLDNQRENLRDATVGQNTANQLPQEGTSSAFKGVSWDRVNRRWLVHVTWDHRQHHVGRFDSEEEAARAYDAAAIGLFGEFAYLNFPAAQQAEAS